MATILKGKYVAVGNKTMRALSGFWNNDHVDMFHKYRVFMAIPVNLLLWGCESWTLKDGHDIFFICRSIPQYMKIKTSEVRDRKTNNEKL